MAIVVAEPCTVPQVDGRQSSMKTWIRDPIAMLAEGGERGLVVEGGRIIELVGQDGPATPCDEVFDARRHVIIPGLVNAHHHFYQTLTRAHPLAINKNLFPWLQQLYPIWGHTLIAIAFVSQCGSR